MLIYPARVVGARNKSSFFDLFCGTWEKVMVKTMKYKTCHAESPHSFHCPRVDAARTNQLKLSW